MGSRFDFEAEIGGFIFWFFKFCKINLEVEQNKNNKARNVFVFYTIAIIITFLSVSIAEYL
ncbi:MAG: hypothetical protein CO119_05140 [Flavobacteriales bacterium CG_4_9_14_3_um_filter_40_17]|nr:MAG: hypothetical protein CO119_05140 [Flavobacteriales bacterium CG_4_9_14_3_um_filter_40_17]